MELEAIQTEVVFSADRKWLQDNLETAGHPWTSVQPGIILVIMQRYISSHWPVVHETFLKKLLKDNVVLISSGRIRAL